MECLFKIKEGRATITDNTRTIWLYQDIIEKYGEQVATKVFMILHYMADMSLDNPFKDVSELDKLEFIITQIAPETSLDVDWNSVEMIDAIELTRKLYETNSYRHYLANKLLLDKLTDAIRFTTVDTSKVFGNAAQIEKTNIVFEKTRETAKKIYEEFLDEQGTVQIRGQGKQSANIRMNGGKSKELE